MSRHWSWLLLAWLVASVSTAGALFLGEVMGMTPCVLCWYQRIFMFPLAIILGIAFYAEDRRGAIYALALSLGGVATALYHVLLVAGVIPRGWITCDAAVSCAEQKLEIMGGIQIPWLSLAGFLLISIFLITNLRKTSK